jgi:hypothetical protein
MAKPKETKVPTPDFSDIYAKAEELGVAKENLDYGLKTDPDKVSDAIKKAHAFKFKGK